MKMHRAVTAHAHTGARTHTYGRSTMTRPVRTGAMYRSLVGMASIITLVWAAPSPPTNLILHVGINFVSPDRIAQMDLEWTPPGTGVVAYRVYCDDKLVQTTRTTTSRVANLAIGTVYKFSVAAVDATGESTRVEASATAQVRPSSPMNVRLVPGDGTIDVFWVRVGAGWHVGLTGLVSLFPARSSASNIRCLRVFLLPAIRISS